MLQGELRRMAQALHAGAAERAVAKRSATIPDVILECLVRPALVSRLTRNFFDYDQTIHRNVRGREAEAVRAELASGALDALLAPIPAAFRST